MNKKAGSKMVLKIVTAEWCNASRDKRELSVVKELGANVLVMAKGDKSRVAGQVDGFDVYYMSTRPLGKNSPLFFNRVVSIFTWAYWARKISPQVISGHDITALLIGYLSTFFTSRKRRPKLVYDSHEFEIGRNAKRNRVTLWIIMHLEHFLIKKCVFSIMVNDSIADEVQRIHKLERRPIVVRSIPENWEIDAGICQETRRKLLKNVRDSVQDINSEKDLKKSNARPFILMYHGIVTHGRGIEMLIKVTAYNQRVITVILGNGEKKYIDSLKRLALSLHVNKKIIFHPAVGLTDLWKYIGAVDVGMILLPAICKSYLYSLPNKFFENIQSETPIIVPNYPAMSEIIRKYQIGMTCNPMDLKNINMCIERMRKDRNFYFLCKKNLRIAKKELCWENEKENLRKAYCEVL